MKTIKLLHQIMRKFYKCKPLQCIFVMVCGVCLPGLLFITLQNMNNTCAMGKSPGYVFDTNYLISDLKQGGIKYVICNETDSKTGGKEAVTNKPHRLIGPGKNHSDLLSHNNTNDHKMKIANNASQKSSHKNNHQEIAFQSKDKKFIIAKLLEFSSPLRRRVDFMEQEITQFTTHQLNISKYRNSQPLIPHIIHQYWDSYDPVPQVYINYIKTVIKHHPEWEYWFWTNTDVDCYFKTRHKESYNLFNKYKETIMKADAMRYFILYDFGGIYMDLDVEVLKPLDIWTYVSPCIISHETYEHTFFVHRKDHPNVINAVMACRPRHPFFKKLQKNLHKHYQIHGANVLYSTGPFFMDEIFRGFKSSEEYASSPVDVIKPDFWFPTFDPVRNQSILAYCDKLWNSPAGYFSPSFERITETLCLKRHYNGKVENKATKQSYLNHHWVHTYQQKQNFKTENTSSVLEVAPHLVNVTNKINLLCSNCNF